MKVKYLGIVVGIVLAVLLFVGAGAASTDDTFSFMYKKINTYGMENALADKVMDNKAFHAKEESELFNIDRTAKPFIVFLAGLKNNPVAFMVAAIEDIQGLGHDYLTGLRAASACCSIPGSV